MSSWEHTSTHLLWESVPYLTESTVPCFEPSPGSGPQAPSSQILNRQANRRVTQLGRSSSNLLYAVQLIIFPPCTHFKKVSLIKLFYCVCSVKFFTINTQIHESQEDTR